MFKNYILCEKRVMAEIQPWGITNYTECNDYHMPNVHSSGKENCIIYYKRKSIKFYKVFFIFRNVYDIVYILILLHFLESFRCGANLENKLIKHHCACVRNESYVMQLFLFQTKMSSLTIMPIEQRQSLSLGYIQLNHIP